MVTSFWNRIAGLDHSGDDVRQAVSVTLVRIWRYFLGQLATTARYAHLSSDPLKAASDAIVGQIVAPG